jgi:hypothetical protein
LKEEDSFLAEMLSEKDSCCCWDWTIEGCLCLLACGSFLHYSLVLLTVLMLCGGIKVVGEELSVLPGMDSLLALGALERFADFVGGLFKRAGKTDDNKDYDVVVYDGVSSEEIFRMFGSAERARFVILHDFQNTLAVSILSENVQKH